MSLPTRVARAAALISVLLAAPALAEGKKVTLSQAFQSMLYLPLYVAIDEGFFTQQGLDFTKETAGAPTVALSAVISGSAQFSIHGPEWTAIAASKGAPVDIIANVVNGAAVWIATAPDFKFDGIKDVKGQKIVTGLMPTTSTSLFMKLLKENGMDAKSDVEMIQVAIGSEPGPFVAKQADIAVMYEPGPRPGRRQGHEGRARISKTLRRLCFLGGDRAQRRRSRYRPARGERHGNGDALHDQERGQDGRDRQEGISEPRSCRGGGRRSSACSPMASIRPASTSRRMR